MGSESRVALRLGISQLKGVGFRELLYAVGSLRSSVAFLGLVFFFVSFLCLGGRSVS